MARRDKTGLIKVPAGTYHPNHPKPYLNAPPANRPATYNKVPLGGLYPLNLVIHVKTPVWCVVETCPDSDRLKHPTGRWTSKDKLKNHLLTRHALDVLEDTGHQTFRILCQNNTYNVRSRGDSVSFYVVGQETVDIAIPAALVGNYQAFVPIPMNQLVQPSQPVQPIQARQAQHFPAQVQENQISQFPSPFGQLSFASDYQPMDCDMDFGLFGDDGAGLDLGLGTSSNPIDLSYLEPDNQPSPGFSDNGLGLGNIIPSLQAVAHNNGSNLPVRQFGYDDQGFSSDAFGLGTNGLTSPQQEYGAYQSTMGFPQQPSPVSNNSLRMNCNQQPYGSQQYSQGFSQQSSSASHGRFDAALGDCIFTKEDINRAALELGINDITNYQAPGFDQDNYNGGNVYAGFNLQPIDDFDQQAAGFGDNSPSQSAVAEFNSGNNSDQVPLTASYFEFDGSVINESAVIASLSLVDAPVLCPGAEATEAASQSEVLATQEEDDDMDVEMNKEFDLLVSKREAIQELAQRASTAAAGSFDLEDAGVVASTSSQRMSRGTYEAPTDIDDLFGDGSVTFLE